VATIFAWSGALRKRGELDGLEDLQLYADALEQAVIEVIEEGTMTGDLVGLWEGETAARKVSSIEFLRTVRDKLEATLALSFAESVR
jgi:isocitrate dehydrogenase